MNHNLRNQITRIFSGLMVIFLWNSCSEVVTTPALVSDIQAKNVNDVKPGEVSASDPLITDFASAVEASSVSPLKAVSLVPVGSSITVNADNRSGFLLKQEISRLALVVVQSRKGEKNLNVYPIDEKGSFTITGLTSGQPLTIIMRFIGVTTEKAQIARDVIREAKNQNMSAAKSVELAKLRFSKAPQKVSANTDENKDTVVSKNAEKIGVQQTPPNQTAVSDAAKENPNSTNGATGSSDSGSGSQSGSNHHTTSVVPSITSQTAFTVDGVASNQVQSATHPVLVRAASAVVDSVVAVHCGVAWGKSGSGGDLVNCNMAKDSGVISVTLPAHVDQTRTGFARVFVKLLDATGSASAAGSALLYISPSVAGLVPCALPSLISDPAALFGSTALASTLGSSFDEATLSTNVKINIGLSDGTLAISKNSLRTTYKKINFMGSDYVAIFKAWPAFTAQHYGSAVSHNDMCRVAQEYQPRNRPHIWQKMLTRFDALVLSTNGVIVGVSQDGGSKRLRDVHRKSGTALIGMGANKSDSPDCESLPPPTSPYRAPTFCIDLTD